MTPGIQRGSAIRLPVIVAASLGLMGCPQVNTDLDAVKSGKVAGPGGAGVGITPPANLGDIVTQTLDTALANCQLNNNLPANTCGGKTLGTGLFCPRSTEIDLGVRPLCSRQYTMKLDVAISGLGQGKTDATLAVATTNTLNKRLDHLHLEQVGTVRDDAEYVFWRAVVNQELTVTVTVYVEGTPLKVDIASGASGKRLDYALCATQTHADPRLCTVESATGIKPPSSGTGD